MKLRPPIPRISRRLMIGGAAAGLATSFSAAAAGPPRRVPYQAEQYRPIPQTEESYEPDRYQDFQPAPQADYLPRYDAIGFWVDTTLDLVALDHSLAASDARAPGPCSSTRAVALAFMVMADAAAVVSRTDYEPLLLRGGRQTPHADAFIGGAVARILEHAFSTPSHSQLIAVARLRFLAGRPVGALRAWEEGLIFGGSEAYTSLWSWERIKEATLKNPTPYVVPPRGHTPDPFNSDQGMYGVGWGRYPTMTPRLPPIQELGPGDPPREWRQDYDEVMELGSWREDPSPEQVRSGLYWAYDGARLIGTPVRAYLQHVKRILEDDRTPPIEAARIYALCALAMSDAMHVCWGAKYHYNIIRPVAAIRNNQEWRPVGSPRSNPVQFSLGADTRVRPIAQNLMGASIGDGNYDPSVRTLPYKMAAFTPSFPSYPSGHATMGAACFSMLRRLRAERGAGDPDRINPRLQFVSDELNGLTIDHQTNRPRPFLPKTFNTLSDMIRDNNRSRVYLGVHWDFDCTRGAESGERVADAVYALAYRRRGQEPRGYDRREPPRSRERYPETSSRRGEKVIAHR